MFSELDNIIDKTYIPYINNHEYNNILFKLKDDLKPEKFHLFKGINGKIDLVAEYEKYKKTTVYHNNIEKNDTYYKLNLDACMKDIIHHERNVRLKKIHTIGAYGHLKTLTNIIQDAIDNKYNKIMILEPDFYTIKNPQFGHILDKIVESDIFYLGASQSNWAFINIILSNGYYKASNTCGTFAVILDKRIFEEYLYLLRSEFYPSDLCLTIFQKYPNIYKTYVSYPNIVICDLCISNTSIKRNQLVFSNTFKWNLENYDVKQIFEFKNLRQGRRKLIIRLNFNQTEGTVLINDINVPFPNNFVADGNNTYEYFFMNNFPMNTDQTVNVIVCNLFVNSVEII